MRAPSGTGRHRPAPFRHRPAPCGTVHKISGTVHKISGTVRHRQIVTIGQEGTVPLDQHAQVWCAPPLIATPRMRHSTHATPVAAGDVGVEVTHSHVQIPLCKFGLRSPGSGPSYFRSVLQAGSPLCCGHPCLDP
jgi:hypothetical protein